MKDVGLRSTEFFHLQVQSHQFVPRSVGACGTEWNFSFPARYHATRRACSATIIVD
jgi:hypothetical protein